MIFLMALAVTLLSLGMAGRLYLSLRFLPQGDPRILEIASRIRRGAATYLRRQTGSLLRFVLVVALLFALLGALGVEGFPLSASLGFLLGAAASMLAGWASMAVATRANAPTVEAARRRGRGALAVAYGGGSAIGFLVVGAGLGSVLLGLYLFGEGGLIPLTGVALGASTVALFARVGGGIFTKAADLGADIVGKLEEGIPEDDPRNPAVIADNVGDNVGDVAGMGADLLESFVGALVAAIVVGFQEGRGVEALHLPLLAAALGVAASLLAAGWTAARARLRPGREASLLRQSLLLAMGLAALFQVIAWQNGLFTTAQLMTFFLGIGCALWVGFWADYYTAPGRGPVKELVDAAAAGPATQVLSGLSLGMMSTALPMLGVAGAALLAYGLEGLFGVALAAVAMLSLTGVIMAVDAYGPIADNAGGIAAMAGLPPEVRRVTDHLDALGNTTAAVGKGLAVGSAALTALALFSGFAASAGLETLSLLEAPVLTGLLLGAIVPYALAAHSLRAVQRAAGEMVAEVRRQWRTIPGLAEGKVSGDADRCIAISTQAALKEMSLPVLAALGLPLLAGVFLGGAALGGFLAGALSSGLALAITMAHAGAAWDNAKKAIEGGLAGGPGSPAHKAAVVGDMVGDPFKDTSGPSLNILIKIMSVVALLLAPFLS